MRRVSGHPNVLSLLDYIQHPSIHCIVLELAPAGDLFDLVADRGVLEEPLAADYFRQLIEGVSHIHKAA